MMCFEGTSKKVYVFSIFDHHPVNFFLSLCVKKKYSPREETQKKLKSFAQNHVN